jgi:hypothetical protein
VRGRNGLRRARWGGEAGDRRRGAGIGRAAGRWVLVGRGRRLSFG